ncbi:hypothetical protein TNCV_175531 [Trichonephila clavipes]|nr:hypothetical protein TNCV_175531 [Trichonephila clavipes]
MTLGVGPVCLDHRHIGFPWPSSDQHMVITAIKVEQVFIKKHNRSPLFSNELWLDTTDIANSNSVKSVEHILLSASLEAVLEVMVSKS